VSRSWLDALLMPLLVLAGVTVAVRLPALASRRARQRLERIVRLHPASASAAPSRALQVIHLACGLLMCLYHGVMVGLIAASADDTPSGGPGTPTQVPLSPLPAEAATAAARLLTAVASAAPPSVYPDVAGDETSRFESGCHAAGLLGWFLLTALTIAEVRAGCGAGRGPRLWCMAAAAVAALRLQAGVGALTRGETDLRLLLSVVSSFPAGLAGLISIFEPDTPSARAYTRPPTGIPPHSPYGSGGLHPSASPSPRANGHRAGALPPHSPLPTVAEVEGQGAEGQGGAAAWGNTTAEPAAAAPRHSEATASFWSRFTFGWLTPLLAKGKQSALQLR
jgi:hypothetical protein